MKCRSCDEKKLQLILDLGSHIPSNFYLNTFNNMKNKKIPLKAYVCKKCWLVQIQDYIRGNKLFLKDYAYLSGVSKTWNDHCYKFQNYCTNKFRLKKNDKILEIASNDGTLLKYFQNKKYDVLGIEPTNSTAKIAKKNGIKTLIKFFSYSESLKIKKKYGNFKLIIANNVLAHVDNIKDFVKGLSYLANKKTIISIEFQYVVNLIKNNQFDTIYHEHFSYYSLISFNNLVDQFNLKIFDVKKINTHGGSLRVFLCNKDNKRKISSNTYFLKNHERKIGINSIKFYLSFSRKINYLRNNFKKHIKILKNENKTIYAYGAAAKGNTFLNYMDLNSDDIETIMDKNVYKIGKISPGGLIKIIKPTISVLKKPDYVLILAWNIKNEIINDLKKNYFYKNKFIISIPKFKIIC